MLPLTIAYSLCSIVNGKAKGYMMRHYQKPILVQGIYEMGLEKLPSHKRKSGVIVDLQAEREREKLLSEQARIYNKALRQARKRNKKK